MNLYEMFEQQQELTLVDALRDFLPLAVRELGLKTLPKIKLARNLHDTHVPTFGRYQNGPEVITVDIENRHPVDILRTIAHEMVHYGQDVEDRLNDESWHTGSDEENEANASAGVIMRKFNTEFPQYLKLGPVILPQQVNEKWSEKYKRSINCNNPKGFSQRAHCQGRKKSNEDTCKTHKSPSGVKTNMCPDDDDYEINYGSHGLAKANESTADSVEIVHEPSGRGHYIEAQVDGREVGRVWFNPTKGGYRATMAWVSPDLRRQGIARKMYQYARDTLGLDIVPSDVQSDDAKAFWATNPVEENFADGKKPGRKGLAKRSGVDCSQSISKLRSIAKSSSGERQRMAHWCANMKSGRNK